MTIYIKDKNIVECLDAREVAPKRSHEQMFVNDTKKSSLEGGLSIAVPGELKGMWELHQRYGKLPWKELFTPVIELCRNGHEVTEYLARVLRLKTETIKETPSLSEIFVNPETHDIWNAGDKIKRLALAKTFEIIAEEGADTMYTKDGKIGRQILSDVKEFGGILTEEDFIDYKVKWLKPAETTLKNGEHLYSMPLSGSGALLIFIMNLLKPYDLKRDALSYHRIMEAYKLSYARRSELADPDFVESAAILIKNLTNVEYANEIRKKIDDKKTHDVDYYGGHFGSQEDHGTAHISILASNGDAISVTGTINYILGSMRRSKTGIILNDEMDDFSIPGQKNIYGIPPSEVNYIKPGKRPMSSMAPSIVVNADGKVSLVVGSAGGSRITTAIAHTIINYYFFKSNDSLWNTFSMKRLHHQLIPNVISFEDGFDEGIITELQNTFNHTVKRVTETIGFGALVGVYDDGESIQSAFDPRRGGSFVVY